MPACRDTCGLASAGRGWPHSDCHKFEKAMKKPIKAVKRYRTPTALNVDVDGLRRKHSRADAAEQACDRQSPSDRARAAYKVAIAASAVNDQSRHRRQQIY
jgi:hypothetical protein